ncbi:MAG TPA: hypothetical protein VLL48_15030, partial [Longimicrobiales bacterium]|nr:hypothetical protein [Longimicrobiales bacterium]
MQELKRRKIVQWSLAYAAAAWVAVEAMDVLGDIFGLPVVLQRGIVIALAFGLIVTIVLAWYHGEKGRQRVSGPELLIVAGVLMTAGATLTLVSTGEDGGVGPPLPGDAAAGKGSNDAPGDPDPRSIAVLPFADLSPAGDQEYLGDGIAEELLSQLSRIPGLRVASRTSSFSLEGEGRDVPAIGRRLGVGHVIEGSVRKSGARLRVEAR